MYAEVEALASWAKGLFAELQKEQADPAFIQRHTAKLLDDLPELFRLKVKSPILDLSAEEARSAIISSQSADLLRELDADALNVLAEGLPARLAPTSSGSEGWVALLLRSGEALCEISRASLTLIQCRNGEAMESRQAIRSARQRDLGKPSAMIGSMRRSAPLLVFEGCLEPSEADQIEELMDRAQARLEGYFGYQQVRPERAVHVALGKSLMALFEIAGFRSRESPFTRERAACYCVAIAAIYGFAVSPASLRSLPSVS